MHVFLAGSIGQQITPKAKQPAKRNRRTKTTDYRDRFTPEESPVSPTPSDLLTANLTKQSSSLAIQAEILELEKKKAAFSMEKERNLLEVSKIQLESAGKLRKLTKNERKHQQEMFDLELEAKKRRLNLE